MRRAAPNRAMRFRERKHLAQWWADHLDVLRLPTSDQPAADEMVTPP